MSIRLLVADDSVLMLERVYNLISEVNFVKIVALLKTVDESITKIDELMPDVVLLDIRIQANNGIDILKHIREKKLPIKVIMFTNYPTEQHRFKCMELGADFFIDKAFEFETIIDILKLINEGKENIS